MQTTTRTRTPSLNEYNLPHQPNHSYSSSSEDSFGDLQSHSRSASGTSQTNYDDPLNTPPPRVLMAEYSRATSPSRGHQRRSSDLSKSAKPSIPDQITMHLLLETAMDDCKDYEVLSPEELRDIKKEQRMISRRIDSAKRRLFIESRVHNTQYSLHRLDHSMSKARSSRSGPNDLDDDEIDFASMPQISQKSEELSHSIWKLERRQTELRDRCLRHTAAVLQLHFHNQAQQKQNQNDLSAYDSDDADETSRQLEFDDGFLDLSDSPRNLKPRLQALSGELYGLISQSGPYSKAGYTTPPEESAGSDDDLTYIEMGLSIIKGLHQELVRYSNDSLEKARQHERTNVVLTGLWDSVKTSNQDLKRSKQAVRALDSHTRDIVDDDSDTETEDETETEEEPFSIQAFSERVEQICSRAAALSQQHVAMHEQITHEREINEAANTDITTQIQAKSVEIESIREQLSSNQAMMEEKSTSLQQLETERADMEAEIAGLRDKTQHVEQLESERSNMEAEIASLQQKTQDYEQLESERSNMEAEAARLQTELTVARAELDSAQSAREQQVQSEVEHLIKKNSDLMSEKADIEERVDMLQKELRELLTEYEGLVKQSVDAEKERDSLEGTIDGLKEKIEDGETKLAEEKLRVVGKDRGSKPVNGEATRTTELTSMGFMRTEFKKMMRDARAEHFRSLRAEQEERRRLEAVIRGMRKEQSSAAVAAASSSLSPQSHGKSGLSNSIAAS